jgi:hypothetical protein
MGYGFQFFNAKPLSQFNGSHASDMPEPMLTISQRLSPLIQILTTLQLKEQ